MGFVAFDIFNEFLHKFGGISVEDIEPNKEEHGSWRQSPYKAFMFKKYGTGLAYVGIVRFEDGTIWKVNDADILPQIQKIQESFTADLLKEKKEEK